MAKQFNDIESFYEFDEIDVVMSQLDTNVIVVEELDEMDDFISQIDMESLYDQQEKVDNDEAGIPEELLCRYQEEISVIDDDLIFQMKDEADPVIDSELPPELLEVYEKAMGAILPKISKNRYEQAYNVFRKWQETYRTSSLHEKLIMAYFSEASSNTSSKTDTQI